MPGANCCFHTCCVYIMLSEVCYVCMPTLNSLLLWDFKERLPEAICCCLQTCNVDVVLYCMYIPGFIVTSTDISQLWVYLLMYCLC